MKASSSKAGRRQSCCTTPRIPAPGLSCSSWNIEAQSMAKMIIEIPDFGVRAVAKLYQDYAPKTLEALRSVLPFKGPGIHAIRAGREVYTLIPKPKIDPGKENQSVFPAPGDLYLFYQPEGYRPMDVPLRYRAEKDTTE